MIYDRQHREDVYATKLCDNPSSAAAHFNVALSSAALASIIMGLSENASLTVPDPAFEADLDATPDVSGVQTTSIGDR